MKATEIINKVKEVIGIELSDEQKEIKLAQAELENGTIVESEEFKEGSEIFIVTEDEKVALPVGEEEDKKEEMAYATKEELEEVKKVVEEIKAILEPKEEEMSDDSTSVKSEEIIKKVVYSSKEEMSEVEKVNHNPEPEAKPNLNLHGQNRTKNTLDRVMARIANK